MSDSDDEVQLTQSPYMAGLFSSTPQVRKPMLVNLDNPHNLAQAYPYAHIGIDAKPIPKETSEEPKFPIKISATSLADIITAGTTVRPGSMTERKAARKNKPIVPPKKPAQAYRLGIDAAPGRDVPLAEYEIPRDPDQRRDLKYAKNVNRNPIIRYGADLHLDAYTDDENSDHEDALGLEDEEALQTTPEDCVVKEEAAQDIYKYFGTADSEDNYINDVGSEDSYIADDEVANAPPQRTTPGKLGHTRCINGSKTDDSHQKRQKHLKRKASAIESSSSGEENHRTRRGRGAPKRQATSKVARKASVSDHCFSVEAQARQRVLLTCNRQAASRDEPETTTQGVRRSTRLSKKPVPDFFDDCDSDGTWHGFSTPHSPTSARGHIIFEIANAAQATEIEQQIVEEHAIAPSEQDAIADSKIEENAEMRTKDTAEVKVEAGQILEAEAIKALENAHPSGWEQSKLGLLSYYDTTTSSESESERVRSALKVKVEA